jgi:hypothetical protein
VVNNKDKYKVNSEIHTIKKLQPSSNLATHQKGIYYFGVKVFNNLPSLTKNLSDNIRQCKQALTSFLYSNSFHSLKEYFNVNKEL